MTQAELNEIVRLHKLWLIGDKVGKKANLSSADLSSADLSSADLRSADLRSDVRIVSVSGVGSIRRMTTFRADTDELWCGCFKGTLAEFVAKIEETHKSNAQHLNDYRALVAMFRAYAAQAGKDQP
jgi:hypothetical protein